MKKTLGMLIVHLFLTCGICCGQNLVVNPSFEDTVHCPTADGQLYNCYGWTSFLNTPDYMNSCNSGSMGVPYNWGGYQQAATGNAYAALASFASGWIGPDEREFAGGHLSQALTIGIKYFVSFKISLTINSGIEANCASNKMGAMFSTIPYSTTNPAHITNNPPIFSDSLITDTVNWTMISGSFIADSAYEYIIIGNFFSNINTDTLIIDDFDSSHLCYGAYYYIDDICVSTDSLNCSNSTVGINDIKSKEEFILFPNPATTLLNIHQSIPSPNQQLIITDLLGTEVYKEMLTEMNISIAISTWSTGLYFYEVRSNNSSVRGKFVKE